MFMLRNNSQYPFNVLDDIYHSDSVHELQIKADMHCVDLNDIDVLIFLIDTSAYHHAFWPHTKKRFTAVKSLLKKSHSLPQSKDFERLKRAVKDRVIERKSSKWCIHTPGGKQEVKNLMQVLDIFNKLEAK